MHQAAMNSDELNQVPLNVRFVLPEVLSNDGTGGLVSNHLVLHHDLAERQVRLIAQVSHGRQLHAHNCQEEAL